MPASSPSPSPTPVPTELEKRLPRAESRGERRRNFAAVAVGLPALVFILAFLWALLRP